MRDNYFIYYFLFLAAALIGFSQSASAAGFGVSPSNIGFTVEKGLSASRQLIIYNTGTDAQFTAASNDPAIAVEPSAGLVRKGKATVLTVTASGKKPGKSASEILVNLAHDRNPGREVMLSLGTRVGVSLAVIESAVPSANFFVGMLTSAGIVVSGLSAYLAMRRKNALLIWKKQA